MSLLRAIRIEWMDPRRPGRFRDCGMPGTSRTAAVTNPYTLVRAARHEQARTLAVELVRGV